MAKLMIFSSARADIQETPVPSTIASYTVASPQLEEAEYPSQFDQHRQLAQSTRPTCLSKPAQTNHPAQLPLATFNTPPNPAYGAATIPSAPQFPRSAFLPFPNQSADESSLASQSSLNALSSLLLNADPAVQQGVLNKQPSRKRAHEPENKSKVVKKRIQQVEPEHKTVRTPGHRNPGTARQVSDCPPLLESSPVADRFDTGMSSGSIGLGETSRRSCCCVLEKQLTREARNDRAHVLLGQLLELIDH